MTTMTTPLHTRPTPHTDSLEFVARWGTGGDGGYVVCSEDLRDLERKLSAAREALEHYAKMPLGYDADIAKHALDLTKP